MKTAIHYTATRTARDAQEIYGMQVAIQDWVRAYLSYGSQEKIPFLIPDAASLTELRDLAFSWGVDIARIVPVDARFPRENLGAFDIVFRADPDPLDLFWQRAYAPRASFAFCGLVHALAGIEGGAILEKYALSPAQEGDAIICPSHAIQAALRRFFDLYGAYIAQRFGGRFSCPVDLPVIPLGTDTQKMSAQITPSNRAAIRASLGVAEDDIVVLWVGRLSAAIKAHPLPMFQAVEQAAKKTGKRVVFAMQGYFVPESASSEFEALARDICQTASVIFIARDDSRFPAGLWAGADIFLSLVDNMQESFGLTPLEAIAAGLPRVLSDWDGYRDSVTSGEDGFLIPTIQPPPETGRDLAALTLGGREMYGGVMAFVSQSVCVDTNRAVEALVALIENPDLRRNMAEKARVRLPFYDWRTIIPRHEALWAEQKARRTQTQENKSWPALPPLMPDPFSMYESYPSAILAETDLLRVCATLDDIRLLWRHPMNVLALPFMLPAPEITALINLVAAHQPMAIRAIFENLAVPPQNHATIWRTLGWLLKLGILEKK